MVPRARALLSPLRAGQARSARPGPVALLLLLGLASVLASSLASAFGWPSEVAQVGRGLSSEQISERQRAAERLSTLSSSSAEPLIQLALEDEEDAVRLAAARAAVVHGQPGLGEQVLGWLKEPPPVLRVAALRVLSLDVELRHIPSIARATLDADETVRQAAVRCLGRARLTDAQETLSALTTALDDASPLVRADAAVALGRLGNASVAGPLVAHMMDSEGSVRRAVAVALGAVGDRKATSALSFALDDRNVGVAAAAARSLGELADPSALPALERAFLKPGWGPLQVASGQALARLDQRRGWDAIVLRLAEHEAAPSLRGYFSELSATAKASIGDCLARSGGLGLLECARVAATSEVPLDALVGRVRRGGLPTAKLFQVVPRTSDVELLVLAIERLTRGTLAERHAALEFLDRSAPLPRETAGLLGEALEVPGLDSRDVARLLLLLGPADIDERALAKWARASDPLVAASARALARTRQASGASVLSGFEAGPLEASAFGRLLSRGMDRQSAERLLSAIVQRKAPLSPAMLDALEGVPEDLSAAGVRTLAELASSEQGAARDVLLSLLVRQVGAGKVVREVFARGSVQDRRSLTGSLLHLPGPDPLGGAALLDRDPWVRAQAAQHAGSGEEQQLLVLARSEAPAFVRTSALLGLAKLAPERAAKAVDACNLLGATELGVRVGALVLVDRANLDCENRPLEDLVLLEREPMLRELAARALGRRDAQHRALRSCRAYDAETDVALACGPRGVTTSPLSVAEPLEFVSVVPPWLDQAAPICPYALLDGAGNVFLGLTDRRGQALVPGAATSRLLDPRVAL